MLKKKTKRSGRRITVGEDKAYDTSDHVAALREMNITPHVAQNDSLTKTGKHRSSAVDGRTTRHIGYRTTRSAGGWSEGPAASLASFARPPSNPLLQNVVDQRHPGQPQVSTRGQPRLLTPREAAGAQFRRSNPPPPGGLARHHDELASSP
jgi:hypothetical protein